MAPAEALAFLGRFLDGRPDDDTLCAAALTIVEPLIDWHWAVVEDDFVALMRERPELRKIVSCCDFDASVPEAVRERLYSFVRPEDDVGGQPAEPEHDRAPKGLVTIAPEL